MIVFLLLIALLFQQPAQKQSRPTEPTDPMPPPNLDYFIGSWSFDWNVPESPLGPAGKMKGTETFKKIHPDWYQLFKAGKMFDGALPMPSFPGLVEAEKALSSAMQNAVLGKAAPKDALAAASKRAQAVVDEFNF